MTRNMYHEIYTTHFEIIQPYEAEGRRDSLSRLAIVDITFSLGAASLWPKAIVTRSYLYCYNRCGLLQGSSGCLIAGRSNARSRFNLWEPGLTGLYYYPRCPGPLPPYESMTGLAHLSDVGPPCGGS